MNVRWEQRRQGMCHGLSPEGVQLAQVAQVLGPGGRDDGWIVWLTHRRIELPRRYPTQDDAIAAAEVALGHGR